jgi:hypothetical protein
MNDQTPSGPGRRVPQGQTSLRREYEGFLLQRIEEYKDALSRQELLALADEAIHELEASPSEQLVLTEVLVLEHVDRIILRRLSLPTFRAWMHARRMYPFDESLLGPKPRDAMAYGAASPFGKWKRPKVHKPPASSLLRLAEFVYARKTYERVFAQLVYDMREEFNEALAAGRIAKARWIQLRGYLAFWSAVSAYGLSSAVSRLRGVLAAITS